MKKLSVFNQLLSIKLRRRPYLEPSALSCLFSDFTPRLLLLTLLLLTLFATNLWAWPATNDWIPVYGTSGFVQDPGGGDDKTGNGGNSTDIVGDSTDAAAYIYNDGIDLYFRLRIDAEPIQGGALKPFGWGVLIDTDLDGHDYEYMLMLDGIANPDEIYLAKNTVQQIIDDPSDKPEQIEWIKLATNGTDYVSTLATSNFTGDADYFIDFKVPYDIFLLSLGITESSLIRYFYGTSQSAQTLSADLISSSIYDGVSDFTLPAGKRPTTGSVQFVADLAGNGDVTEFYPGATLYLKVVDDDQNSLLSAAETVPVTLTSPSGDSITVTLTETGINTGIFIGSVATGQGTINSGDNILQIMPVEFITATYLEAADALFNINQNRTDTAKAMPTADLRVTKVSNNYTPNTNDVVTFTLTLSNNGPSNASGIQVKDLLAAGLLQHVSNTGGGTYNPSTGIWTVPSLATGNSITLQIQARVLAPAFATIDNTVAILSSSQPDSNLANNSASISLAVTGSDLKVSNTVTVTNPAIGGDTPQTGNQVTYTITIHNLGSYAASGVVIRDLLPAGQLTWLSDTSGGTYNPVTGNWSIGSLANGATATLQIVATVNAVGGNTVTNTATVFAVAESDPVTSNNSASVNIYVDAADLKVTKTINDPTPDEGDTITYTVRVDNLRGSTAGGIQVLDLLPAGLQFVSASPPAGTSYDAVSGIWNFNAITLASGTFRELTINALVKTGTAAQTITNTARITVANKIDPVLTNNNGSVFFTVRYLDLAIGKTTSSYSPNNDAPITFTLTVTNNGPIAATGVKVYDLLSTHVYNDVSGGSRNVAVTTSFTDPTDTYSLSTGIWDIGNLAVGASTTLTVNAVVKVPTGASSTFFNLAQIIAVDQADPFSGNDADSVLMGVKGTDIQIVSKTVDKLSPAAPNAGIFDTVTYTIVVTNNGPNPATNLTISEVIPAGLTFVASSATENYTPPTGQTDMTAYTASTGLWTLGYKNGGSTLFPVGATVTLTLQAQVTALSGSIITNTALVNSLLESDTSTANNSASVTITVGGTNLQMLKTVSDPTPTVGENITWTLTVHNLGPNVATTIKINDLLPAGLTYLSHTAGQNYNSLTGLWDLGASPLAVGGSATLNIVTTVGAAAAGQTVTNTASILSASAPDPTPGNNNASTAIIVQESDTYIINTVNNATPDETTQTTFTLTVGNNGPHDSGGITVLDLLPPGLVYVSSTPSVGTITTSNNPDGSTNIAWDLGAYVLPKNAFATLTITVSTRLGTGTFDQINTASITSQTNYDSNSGNNSASIAITPNRVYIDLAVSKNISDPTPDEGENFTYTVTLANNNATYAASGVQVTDLLPAGIIFISATPAAGTTYDDTTGLWVISSIAAAEVKTLTITATAALGTGGTGPITNTATITASDFFDPVAANNSAAVNVDPVVVAIDLALNKTGPATAPVEGTDAVFTLTLNNPHASLDATNIVVTDVLPLGLTFVSATPSVGSLTVPAVGSSGNVVWTIPTLTAARNVTLTLTARSACGSASAILTNNASIGAHDQVDPVAANNSASASVTPTPDQPNLLILKSADATRVNSGQIITYTLQVQNSGCGLATNVKVQDPLSPYLALILDYGGTAPPGQPFEFLPGSSGLAIGGTGPVYYNSSGEFTPNFAGGEDGTVTSFEIPFSNSFSPGGQFTLRFKARVK